MCAASVVSVLMQTWREQRGRREGSGEGALLISLANLVQDRIKSITHYPLRSILPLKGLRRLAKALRWRRRRWRRRRWRRRRSCLPRQRGRRLPRHSLEDCVKPPLIGRPDLEGELCAALVFDEYDRFAAFCRHGESSEGRGAACGSVAFCKTWFRIASSPSLTTPCAAYSSSKALGVSLSG